MESSPLIIGSGIAGIATAIRLAVKGHKPHVFEASSKAGGKLDVWESEGYRFDKGPSLFTLPELVEELFTLAGRNPKDYFRYKKLDTLCHYFWEDKTFLKAEANPKSFAQEAEKVLGEPAQSTLDFLEKSARDYALTSPVFLEKSLHKLSTYLSKDTLKAIPHLPFLGLNKSMNGANTTTFSTPKMVQLFNRYATYNGSNPYKAPAILNVIPNLEFNQGAFFPTKGMRSIVDSLVALAEDLGVTFHYNSPVEEIILENDKAIGIKAKGKNHFGSSVVSNMDVVPTFQKLLPNEKAPAHILKQERSSSALIFYWGIKKEFPQLDVHNILFSDSYQKEFEALFETFSLIDDPTIYIHISSKVNAEDAPKGCENWFVMVNAPCDQGQDWDSLIAKTRENILNKLERILGENVRSLIETEDVLSPPMIQERTSSFKGSLYGTSSNSQMSAFFRHPNFSSSIKGLYFCGGSVHPGGGIPLSLLSAKICTEVMKEA